MKYTKSTYTLHSNLSYYMELGNGRSLEVFTGDYSPSIQIISGGLGEIESTQQEFEQAFMTVSNRFRTSVFNDNTTTRTETNTGNYTEIIITPKNEK